jgi:3-oxoadipate enol-lactonase/4-carboxymuconolactone decarboxylase
LPFANIRNIPLFYRMEGRLGAPVLMLSHSIGTDHAMWDPQVPAFLPHFQVLRYDTRGHGASQAPKGDYSIEQLGQDVLGLAAALGIEKFAFCGLSLGGAIGQWLGIHASDRLTRLILANTSPQFGPRANWDGRIRAVSDGGMAAIVDMAMQRFFSPETLARGDVYAASIRSVLLGTDPVGYIGCCAALRDVDHREMLRHIRVPTLLIVADRDVSTPWEGHGEILAREIPGIQTIRLSAAHLSNIERPHSFTAAVRDFMQPALAQDGDPLEAGDAVRRQILGDAHVDHALARTNDFNSDFQNLITRYAWGSIWTRPGIDPRTRRLLVLAMMASMGRWEEFRMHVRAGLAHELETCDLKEALRQTAIYAGVPAANTGFHIANEEIEKAKQK